MTRVSRVPLKPKVYEQIMTLFWEVTADLGDEELVKSFFNRFLSKAEKTMLAKRLTIAVMITAGLNSPEISERLKVSTSTVRDVAYKLEDATFKDIVSKFTDKFKRSDKKSMNLVEALLGAKSNMKARAKLLSGDFD